jgi:iron complex transport system permease protein
MNPPVLRRNTPAIFALLGVLALAGFAFALFAGSIHIAPGDIWRAMSDPRDSSTATAIVQELRLPRALTAFTTGALLALAGALMQVLLRNPLADPYVLGISGGAAVGALGAMLLGFSMAIARPCALAGALLSMLLVFGLAHGEGRWSHTRLLLTGVIVASGWGALITLLLTLAPDAQLRGMLFWLIGDLSGASGYGVALLVLLAVMLLLTPWTRDLNQLARGDVVAASLGVNVKLLRWGIYVIASLATAAAVTTGGAIGFVGFVIPHALRMLIGNDQRLLLPAVALAAGAFLVLADTLARTIAAPLQLPVGVITALVGVPLFLVLLARKAK